MLNKINMLREKLEDGLLEGRPYEEILEISREIDALLVDYYKSVSPIKENTLFLIK